MPFLMEQGVSIVGSMIGLIYLIVTLVRQSDEDNAFIDHYLSSVTNDNESIRPLLPYIIGLALIILIESAYSWIVILSLYQEFTNMDRKVEDSVHTVYPHQNAESLFDPGYAQNANAESLFDYVNPSGQMPHSMGKSSSRPNTDSLFAYDYADNNAANRNYPA